MKADPRGDGRLGPEGTSQPVGLGSQFLLWDVERLSRWGLGEWLALMSPGVREPLL